MNKAILSVLCLTGFATNFPYILEEDQQRTVSSTNIQSLELQAMTVVVSVDGEEREMPVPERTHTLISSDTLVFTDTISNIEDGRPRHILREFNELSREESQEVDEEDKEPESAERTGRSPLNERSVNLKLDAEGEWSASIVKLDEDDAEFDEEVLDGLTAHYGFTGLLPEGLEGELGDSWEIPLENFSELFAPAGRLSFRFETESGFPGYGNQFMENLEGEISAKYIEWNDEEKLAVIELTCSVKTNMEDGFDLTMEGAEGEVARKNNIELELSGELLWNFESGSLKSISMGGEVSSSLQIVQSIRPDDGPFGERISTQSMQLAGDISLELSVE
jgi:hypothetical protein